MEAMPIENLKIERREAYFRSLISLAFVFAYWSVIFHGKEHFRASDSSTPKPAGHTAPRTVKVLLKAFGESTAEFSSILVVHRDARASLFAFTCFMAYLTQAMLTKQFLYQAWYSATGVKIY